MGSLSNLYISQSYQSLIHLGTNNTASANLIELQDGLGNSIGVAVDTIGNLYISGTLSASLQEGYLLVGNSNGRTIAVPTSSISTTINTGSLVTTASFNSYTASTNIRLNNIEIATGSILISINNLNASSASQQVSINALNVFTASQSTASIVSSITQLNQFTQSADIRLDNLELTSASVNTSISNINAYTQSNDLKWQDLGSKSGSWITESETGSFARYDVSNPWSADQNFTNISAVSASFTYIKTIFETASVIYSSGSNQFGDELSDVQTLSGSVKIRGGLLVNDLDITGSINSINVFTQSASDRLNNLEAATSSYAISSSVAAVDAAQQLQINSLIAATSSYADSASFAASQLIQDGRLNNLESTSASVNISISNLNQFTASISTASIVNSINELNQFTQSANSRLNNIEAATSSYANSASVAIVDAGQNVRLDNLELFTSSLDQTYVTQAELAAATGALEISIDTKLDTASFNSFTQSYIADSASFDSRIDALESFSSSLDVTFVNQSELAAATGALETSIATKLDTASFNSYTQSNDQKWNDLQPFTASLTASVAELLQLSASLSGGFVTEGELQAATASLINQINTKLDTASFNSYTQSNDSIVNSLVAATSSYAISASVAAVDAAQQSQIDSLINATSSYVTETESGSFLITASFNNGNRNLTFTKGDTTTFDINIPASPIDTASFATTGSNVFRGNQIISGSLTASGSNINLTANAITLSRVGGITSPSMVLGNAFTINAGGDFLVNVTSGFDFKISSQDLQLIGSTPFFRFTNTETNGGASMAFRNIRNAIVVENLDNTARMAIFSTSSIVLSGSTSITGSTDILGTFTASLAEGFTYVGNSAGRTIAIQTASFASLINTASFATTESFNAYTQSTNNRLNNLESTSQSVNISITNLNNFTASIDTNFVSETEFGVYTSSINAFTQSANNRLQSLESATSSYAISASVAAVDAAQQAQIDALISATSSYADSASFAASQLAQDIRIDGLSSQTASYAISASVAAVDAAQQAQINSLIAATASYADSASFAASQLAQDGRLNNLESTTASLNISVSNLNGFTQSANIRLDNLELTSQSVNVSISNLNNYTQSNDLKWSDLESKSGSWITESETGSFARYDVSNPWSADQVFTNISATSASFLYVQTTYETASVIYSSGSNQFGDELTDTQTLSGSVLVRGGLFVNDIDITSSLNNINVFTQSADQRLDSLEAATSSYAISASVAAVDAAQQAQIDSLIAATSSYADSASFAASQLAQDNRLGSLEAATSSYAISSSVAAVDAAQQAQIDALIAATASYADSASVAASQLAQDIRIDGLAALTASVNNSISNLNSFTQSADGRLDNLELTSESVNISISNINAFTQSADSRLTNIESTTASLNISVANINVFTQSADGRLTSLEAYTQSNDLKWSDLGSKSGSWVTESETGSFLITSSFDETTRNLRFNRANSTFYDIGGFATTGSNVFRGTETFEDAAGNWSSLHPISGGFYLVGRGYTSASAHISSSNASLATANGLTNIVFKTNNNTADTILSGSSNIFTNTGAPTAGFKRYLSTANLSLAGALPQISGSMAFSPTITGNILAYTAATANPMTIRGPVSSSAYSITTNLLIGGALNLGTSAANNFQQAVNGVAINNNLIGGTFGLVANRTRLTQTVSIGGNQIQGAATFNMNSSSIDASTSLFYGTNTINNNSTGSSRVSAAGNAVGIYQTNYFGTNTTTFSGSNDPNDVQDLDYQGGIYRSLIVGTNTQFVITGPTGSNSINNTGIIGNGLIVTGSSGNQNFGNDTLRHGSLFAGRWNADGTRNRTSENVFAIGTGTSNTARKTGFLIDSGSNTFIEGTLNVSGSSTLSGSLYIQSGSTLPSSTGSSILTWNAATGQVNQASFSTIVSASVSSAEFWSTITESGSAGVSGSITFNNSGSFYNVSLVNGTQLTVANGGVYNIQFSAQIETSAGADTVYIWFKKNGTNIGDSASKAVLANNTAQIMTVNILDEAQANDYYEIAYQTLNGNATVLAEAASGNIPAIPSVIATIFQIR